MEKVQNNNNIMKQLQMPLLLEKNAVKEVKKVNV